MLFDWIIANKELVKFLYGILIPVICFIIVVKTNTMFRLSSHQGIRYFRNAFLFYGIAFIFRYILGSFFFVTTEFHYLLVKFLFEFFLIMAGFFLLYSLIWKKVESPGYRIRSSLLNGNILVFYVMALIISILDQVWNTFYFMFFSQIALFILASVLSYMNYRSKGGRRKFLKYYFLAMVLSLVTWILNAIAAIYFNWDRNIILQGYVLNSIIFLLFLFGVMYFSRKT